MREHQGQVSQKKYSLFSMEVLITCEKKFNRNYFDNGFYLDLLWTMNDNLLIRC